MRVFYSDTFELPLPTGHRFPIIRYRRLREHLQASQWQEWLDFSLADAARDEQLCLAHTADYLEKLRRGTLTPLEERRIGFPYSQQMVERSRRSVGATVAAATAALADGAAAHLAGGTHHAFADHGQGFCVFNDVAVAIRVLQNWGLVERAVVIDLDVHQGNGTAAIFASDDSVFTVSVHGDGNFPFVKVASDVDVGLPDGTTDVPYLACVRELLEDVVPLASADLVCYLAGADPFGRDRLGKLALTKAGLAARDKMVFEACRQVGVPVAVVMAGGYAEDVQDVVDINAATIGQLLEANCVRGHEHVDSPS